MKRKHTVIAAGLATPENQIEKPNRRDSDSLTSQIANLAVGEDVVSKAKRIDDKLTIAKVRELMPTMRQEMRNNLNKAVARAKELTGGEYHMEVFDTHSLERSWFLLALITRIK